MMSMKLRAVYELNTSSVKNSKIDAIRIEIFKNMDSTGKYSARIYFHEIVQLNVFVQQEGENPAKQATIQNTDEPLWVDKTYLWQNKWSQFSALNSKKAAKNVIKDVQSYIKTLVDV